MKVTIYTQVECDHCGQLKKWLAKNNITFKEINIHSNKEAFKKFLEFKPLGTPFILIEDKGKMKKNNGFSHNVKEAIKKTSQ